MHQQACFIKSFLKIGKYFFTYLMLLKKMAKFEQRCRVRNLLIIKNPAS